MHKRAIGVFLILLLALVSAGADKKKKAYELIYQDVQLLTHQFLQLKEKIEKNSEDIKEVYNMAYSDYRKGNFELAIDGFKMYRVQFPESPLADNSLYWIGECYFSQKKYAEAIEQFNELLLNYPRGDKIPAAYLKKGISLMELRKKEESLIVFKLLISKYPLEEETKIAQQKIRELLLENERYKQP